MFQFLNPAFLIASSAALIPLVLHLMQSSKTVRLPFSTVRFIKLAEKKSSRRIKMEHFLLWLLRTLLMLLISLAFAMPMLRTKNFGKFFSQSKRDIAIIIDTSYSMNYQVGKQTVWEKATKSAQAIIEGLNDGDRLCIFQADENSKAIVDKLSEDKEFATGQIKGMEPGFGSSQLAPAVIAGNDALMEEKTHREHEIHIITDGQALPWSSFGQELSSGKETGKEKKRTKPSNKDKNKTKKKTASKKTTSTDKERTASVWDPSKINDQTAVFIDLLGASSPEDVAPSDVEVLPKILMADIPAKINVTMTYSGPPKSTAVSILVDEKEIANRSMVVGAETAETLSFAIPPMAPGAHAARIEIPDDNLPIDNTFHFIFKVKDKLPTLIVGSKDDTLFLKKALGVTLTQKSTIDITRADPNKLSDEVLTDYSCIFLCNAIQLDGNELMRIEQYVKNGGLIAIFPGDNSSISDYAAWSCLPAKPISLLNRSISDRKQVLRWKAPQHPLLQTLKIGASGAPIVTIRRNLEFGELDKKATELISAGADIPFLMDREFGNGHVLFFNVAADRTWSSFPLSAYYLPIAHQIIQYGAGIGANLPYIWGTKDLSLLDYLPQASKDSFLKFPDGKNAPILSASMNGKTILHVENMLKPGIYTLATIDNPEPQPALAVNISRDEANLTPIRKEDLPSIMGIKNMYISENKEDMLKQIEDHRVGKTLGEMLLWLIVIVATIEYFYSNRLSQGATNLSETLGIEESGKVTGFFHSEE